MRKESQDEFGAMNGPFEVLLCLGVFNLNLADSCRKEQHWRVWCQLRVDIGIVLWSGCWQDGTENEESPWMKRHEKKDTVCERERETWQDVDNFNLFH